MSSNVSFCQALWNITHLYNAILLRGQTLLTVDKLIFILLVAITNDILRVIQTKLNGLLYVLGHTLNLNFRSFNALSKPILLYC